MIFKKDTHQYFNEYGVEYMSVTTLLKKHGLAPDYSGVDSAVLKKASERGTEQHELIENYINEGTITNLYCKLLDNYLNENNITNLKAEQLLWSDKYLIAGTADIVGDKLIMDNKFISKMHYTYVQWQLSLYAYLLDPTNYKKYNIRVLHFNNDRLRAINLDLISKDLVEELLETNLKGEIFKASKPYEQYIDNNTEEELINILMDINALEAQIKELNIRKDNILNNIKTKISIGSSDVLSIKAQGFTISYDRNKSHTTLNQNKVIELINQSGKDLADYQTTTYKESISLRNNLKLEEKI